MRLPETMPLPLEHIERASDTQARAGLNTDAIAEYRRWIEDGHIEHMPPIDVFFDGANHHIADGWHRFEAATEAGLQTIVCRVHKGSEREARIFACGVNDKHGVRRTLADRRRAVEILVRDEEWSTKSSRMIADHCKVSHDLVEKTRNDIAESTGEIASSDNRTGADGKARKAPKPKAAPSASKQEPTPEVEGFETDGAEGSVMPAAVAKNEGGGKSKSERGGKEKITAEQRKEAKRAFGVVTRFVDSLGHFDGVSAVTESLETIAGLLKEQWG